MSRETVKDWCRQYLPQFELHRMRVIPHEIFAQTADEWLTQFLGWVERYGMLYKRPVVAVAPQYTSQDCSGCRTRVKKTLSVRTHVCPKCNLVIDRDKNAALNILTKGLNQAGLSLSTVGHTETNAWGENNLCVVSESLQDKLARGTKNLSP